MLDAIVVRDFRSFLGRHEFEIRPLTVLLGRNSSGKSTITRLLPLLQQSFELRTSAPVLWNGANVDFGSVSEVRPRQKTASTIGLGISLTPNVEMRRALQSRRWGGRTRVNIQDGSRINYEVSLVEQFEGTSNNERTRLAGFSLSLNGDEIAVDLTEDGKVSRCLINGTDYKTELEKSDATFDTQSFFPTLRTKKIADVTAEYYHTSVDNLDEFRAALVSHFAHGSTTLQTKRSLALSLIYSTRQQFQYDLARISTDYFANQVSSYISHSPELIERLRNLTLLSALPTILTAMALGMNSEMGKLSYVGPTRAAGERYYRWRELAVDRLDPKGENFAMYVMSLSYTERTRLSSIFEDAFGYALKATQEGGHASIMLSEAGSDRWYNLADMGFGFSQILPVIAQIHASSRSIRQSRNQPAPRISDSTWIMSVEQPELHLHPAFQAKIADLFAEVSTPESPRPLPGVIEQPAQNRFIIETHSEALVNRLSELISMGKVKKEDAVIYIFDKDDGGISTNVRRVDFDESGNIAEWPYGFFHY